ncbi:MAG: ABC transporter permease [Bacteroidia bacterium]
MWLLIWIKKIFFNSYFYIEIDLLVMVTYILKRLLFFIPTLFIISLMAFWISVASPGDPVDNFAGTGAGGLDGQSEASFSQLKEKRDRIRKKFNLHLPIFYVGLSSMAEPDTLYRFFEREEKEGIGRLLSHSGNWPALQKYRNALLELRYKERFFFEQKLKIRKSTKRDVEQIVISAYGVTQALIAESNEQIIEDRFYQLDTLFAKHPVLVELDSQLISAKGLYAELQANPQRWKNYIPSIDFYGTENQYHKWVWNILTKLDFGNSYANSQPVSDRIGDLFFWSTFFSLTSIFLAYLISIPLGIIGASLQNSRFDKITTITVFAMDSLPNFWVATLLLVTFANPDVFNWFPSSFNEWDTGASRFVLPMIAYTYGNIAFASRIMRASMLEVIQQDYIRTAYAKGLRRWVVISKHAARNALLPIITGFAGLFPAMLGGQVVLETIFSIPGMGREVFEASFSKDVPMIMAVFTVTGFLTIMGYLVSDLLYTIADPRIRLNSKD